MVKASTVAGFGGGFALGVLIGVPIALIIAVPFFINKPANPATYSAPGHLYNIKE